ncbi:hypothetical protein, partial [Desulfovibrio legallii]|uniref:hypothetical protein n=1 Tax=Desulfovibrio legallii TaxID=571438 RepID=UPI0022E4F895
FPPRPPSPSKNFFSSLTDAAFSQVVAPSVSFFSGPVPSQPTTFPIRASGRLFPGSCARHKGVWSRSDTPAFRRDPLEHLTLEMLAYGRQKPAFSHFVARIFKKILAEQLAHFIR